jgi:DNA-binding transcriptional ArsR family regulator
MSIEALSWALEQRNVEASAFRVLVHLANRHNKDTRRCDPCQHTLAHDCEMSRATVNRHLSKLEAAGILKRVQRENPKTGRPMSTLYILGIDFDRDIHVENAVSQDETRKRRAQSKNKRKSRVSNCDTAPCLKSDEFRVSSEHDSVSHGRDTKQEYKPEDNHCAASRHTPDFNFDDFCEEFLEAYPRLGSETDTIAALKAAIDDGAEAQTILAGAKAYAVEQKGNAPQYVAYSENWLKSRRWEGYARQSKATPTETRSPKEIRIAAIKSGMHAMCGRINSTQALELIREGAVSIEEARKVDLVTLEACRRAGVLS